MVEDEGVEFAVYICSGCLHSGNSLGSSLHYPLFFTQKGRGEVTILLRASAKFYLSTILNPYLLSFVPCAGVRYIQ